jgi:hypothetical protein
MLTSSQVVMLRLAPDYTPSANMLAHHDFPISPPAGSNAWLNSKVRLLDSVYRR